MENNELDSILNFVEKRADKSASSLQKKRDSDKFAIRNEVTNLGGMVGIGRSAYAGKKSLLYNGCFEYQNSHTLNPVGWFFDKCFGLVNRYDSLASDATFAATTGNVSQYAQAIPDFVYDGGGAVSVPVYMASFSVDGLAGSVPGSSKFVSIQPMPVSGAVASSYSTYQIVPRGITIPGEVYYLSFKASSWNLYAGVNRETLNGPQMYLQPTSGTSGYYLNMIGTNKQFDVRVTVRITFLDSNGGAIDTYTSSPLPLSPGLGWMDFGFAFCAHKKADSMKVEFSMETMNESANTWTTSGGECTSCSMPHSICFDDVRLCTDAVFQKSGSMETYYARFGSKGHMLRSNAYVYAARSSMTGYSSGGITFLVNGAAQPSYVMLPWGGSPSALVPGLIQSYSCSKNAFATLGFYANAGDRITTSGSGSGEYYLDVSTI